MSALSAKILEMDINILVFAMENINPEVSFLVWSWGTHYLLPWKQQQYWLLIANLFLPFAFLSFLG